MKRTKETLREIAKAAKRADDRNRKRELRADMKSLGLQQVTVSVHRDQAEEIRGLARKLKAQRET
jgi:ribosomal protein L30/L7E